MQCLNCEHEFEGKFCPQCGQAAATGRLTARSLGKPLLELANVEHGLFGTIFGLLRRPGAVINGYLAGRRVAYVPPVKFVVIAVSSALLALWLIGPAPTGQGQALDAEMARVMERWGNLLLLLTVPLCALGTRVVFRRRGLNLTEHLALNAYVFALQNWVSLIFLPWPRLGPLASSLSSAVYLLFCIGYFAVALRQTLARHWWSAVLAAGLITLVAWGVFYIVMGAVIVALRG